MTAETVKSNIENVSHFQLVTSCVKLHAFERNSVDAISWVNSRLQLLQIYLPGSGVIDRKCDTKVILGFILEGRARLVLHKL